MRHTPNILLVIGRHRRSNGGRSMNALLCATALGLAAVLATAAESSLGDARRLMRENQPDKAAQVLQQLKAAKPNDPWLDYNLAVSAYATQNFQESDRIWQQLAARQLPENLRDAVWTQIGNVSFRKGEPFESNQPEAALPHWEQSREAYRIVLATRPKDKLVQHNLRVVESKLARIHSRLGERLLNEAQKKNLEETIQKMQAALDHQRDAQRLDPQTEQYQKDVQKTAAQLSEKFNEKAAREEAKADNALKNQSAGNWEREQAIKNLENALTDYREAKALNEQNRDAAKGEERVQEKLSQLLTQQGQQLQKEGQQEANYNPDNAIGKLDQALNKYEEALQMNENNQAAKKGEQEVKAALEQLNMKRGDQLAKEGRQEKQYNPADAAEKMMAGMQHYEQALEVNPNNQEAPPKIEALEKELPPMLNELGKREQERADQAEAKSLDKAAAHLEKAATSYDMAQQIDENNQEAQQGSQQVRDKLAKLREKIAQRAQEQAQQPGQKQPPQNLQSFQAMLGWVKSDDKQKQYEESRRAPTTKYDPDNNRIHRNW